MTVKEPLRWSEALLEKVKERLGPKWLPLLIAIDGPDNIGTHSGGGDADARSQSQAAFSTCLIAVGWERR